jgi:single-stranded DNA-binding protein
MIESLISGKLHGNPQQRISKTGKPFVTAKMRVSTGEEQAQFVNVTAFSDSVQGALLALGEGDAVAVAGTMSIKTWVNREGATVPDVSIIAAQVLSVYHLKRKRQAVQQDAGEASDTPPRQQPKQPRQRYEPDLEPYGNLDDF